MIRPNESTGMDISQESTFSMTTKFLLRLIGISGALAVILASFAAHGLEHIMSPNRIEIFSIGVRYQLYHTLAMLAVLPIADGIYKIKVLRACRFWILGILIFSGSLYLLAVTDAKWLGMITPFGGLALIIGWILLIP